MRHAPIVQGSIVALALLLLVSSNVLSTNPSVDAGVANLTDHRISVPDTLRGGPGDDVLSGTDGADLIDGGPGNDELTGAGGDDVLQGGEGSDVVDGGVGDDLLVGGAGVDWLFGGTGDDLLRGGVGNDVLEGDEGNDHLDGGEGDDILEGGDGDDVLLGGAGDDTMDGGDGNTTLYGGPGNDYLKGSDDGNQVLNGGDGDDTLIGGEGSDYLAGGPDNDLLFGGDRSDVVLGGPGDDMVGGGDGDDVLDGGPGNDLVSGGTGADVLRGGTGIDTLLGADGDDRLDGGAGADVLHGGRDNDVLEGGADDDFLLGGLGTDQVRGGLGSDVVVLRRGDVDSLGVEIVDGGTDPDSMPSFDTLILNGFNVPDLTEWIVAGGGSTGDTIQNHRAASLTDPLTGGSYHVARFERVVHSLFFPHAALGGDGSMLVLVNPSASEPVSGTAFFAGEDGAPEPISIDGAAPDSLSTFSIRPLGRISLALTSPETPAVATGRLRILASQPLGGVLSTSIQLGRTGIQESPMVDAFAVPIQVSRINGFTTGVAVSNSGVETSLKVTLWNPGGGEEEATEFDLPANGHRVVWAHELFPRFEEFRGVLSVEGGPVVGSGLQVLPGFANITTTPILPLRRSVAGTDRFFAHVTSGAGSPTSIILVNTEADTAKGTVVFFGNDGNELTLALRGIGPTSSVPFELPFLGSIVLTTADQGPALAGAARALVTSGRVDGVVWNSFDSGSRAGSGASEPMKGFITPVSRRTADGITTQLAMHSTGSPVTLQLVLRNTDGIEVSGGRVAVRLPEGGRVARPLEAFFPNADTAQIEGTVTVIVDGGSVAALAVRVGRSPGAAVLVLPVVPTN